MELRAKMHALTLRFILICRRKQSLISQEKEKGIKKQGGVCLQQLLSKELQEKSMPSYNNLKYCFGVNCLSIIYMLKEN